VVTGGHFRRFVFPVAVACVLAACAQGGPQGDRGPEGRASRGGPSGGAGPSLGKMGSPDDARKRLMDDSARQLADARQQLRITPAQSGVWDAYAGSVGALVSDLARFDSEPIGATPQQRVNRRVDRARNRYTALENVADSMRALYATLSDEQRATADRILVATVPSLYEGSPFGGGGAEPAQGQQAESISRRRGRADTAHF
jgi:hypothetical protein